MLGLDDQSKEIKIPVCSESLIPISGLPWGDFSNQCFLVNVVQQNSNKVTYITVQSNVECVVGFLFFLCCLYRIETVKIDRKARREKWEATQIRLKPGTWSPAHPLS